MKRTKQELLNDIGLLNGITVDEKKQLFENIADSVVDTSDYTTEIENLKKENKQLKDDYIARFLNDNNEDGRDNNHNHNDNAGGDNTPPPKFIDVKEI